MAMQASAVLFAKRGVLTSCLALRVFRCPGHMKLRVQLLRGEDGGLRLKNEMLRRTTARSPAKSGQQSKRLEPAVRGCFSEIEATRFVGSRCLSCPVQAALVEAYFRYSRQRRYSYTRYWLQCCCLFSTVLASHSTLLVGVVLRARAFINKFGMRCRVEKVPRL